MSPADFRRACRAYAERFIGVMTEEFQRLGVFGDWAAPVPDDELPLPGGHRARARQVRRARPGLQGQEARPLVHPLPDGAGRGRSRVPRRTRRPRSTSSSRSTASSRAELARRVPGAGRTRRCGAHLDDDALDDPVEPGDRVSPRRSSTAPTSTTVRVVLMAEDLAARVVTAAKQGRSASRSRASRASDLEGLKFTHPLYDRDSLAVLADYVTLEQGTGAVHTAPGHGADDYLTGMKYGLEIYAPVGPGRPLHWTMWGCLRASRCSRRTRRVVEALTERGRLWHYEPYQHTYPHCWRCHNPVIFLATSQWFVRMDGEPSSRRTDASPRRCATRRSTRSTEQWSGSRRGAATASTTWSRTAPTGASRASAPGACRSRRSTARAAAKPSSPARSSSARRRCSTSTAPTRGTSGPLAEFVPDGPDVPEMRRDGVRAREQHPRRLVRLRARATRRCCRSGPS